MHPVVFSIFCQNSNGFPGFKNLKENSTAYPIEREFLLREGQMVVVLHVREVTITNNNSYYKKINGKSVTIIHLWLPE